MHTKTCVLQMPVSLYAKELTVVETEIEIPMGYTPAVGSFFVCDELPGRLSVHWWGYDHRDKKTYMCLSVGYSDSTRTIEEWLTENKDWKVADDPLVALTPTEEP